jgi:uncharacterized membrane protein YjdF
MACPNPSRGVYLTRLFQGLIFLSIVSSVATGKYFLAFLAFLAFIMTMTPYLVTRKMHLCLPWEVNLLITISLFLHLMGHVEGYYMLFSPFYDKITHLVSSVTVAVVAFFGAVLADHYQDLRLTRPMIIFFVVIFTLAMGAAWEIYEFTLDQLFGLTLQNGNTDTMTDLIVDLCGATIVAVIADLVLRRTTKENLIGFFADPSLHADQSGFEGDPQDPAKAR